MQPQLRCVGQSSVERAWARCGGGAQARGGEHSAHTLSALSAETAVRRPKQPRRSEPPRSNSTLESEPSALCREGMRYCGRSSHRRTEQHACHWCHTLSTQSTRTIADGYTCEACTQWNGFDEEGNYSATKPADQPSTFTPSRLSRGGARERRADASVDTDAAAASHAPSLFPGSSAVTLCEHCQRNQELLLRKLASFDDSASLDSHSDPDGEESFERFKAAAEADARLCHECQQRVARFLSAQDEAIRRERIIEKQCAAASKLSTWRKINVASPSHGDSSWSAAAAASSSATPSRSASWILLHLLILFTSALLILSHIVPTLRGFASRAPHLEGRSAFTLGEWLHASWSHNLMLLAHWALHEQEFVLTVLMFLEVVSTARRSGSSGKGGGDGQSSARQRTQRWTGSVWGLAQLVGLASATGMFVARTEWVLVSPRIVRALAVANLIAVVVRTVVLIKSGARRESNSRDAMANPASGAQSGGRLTPTSAAFDFGANSSSPPSTPLRSATIAPRVARSGSHSRASRSSRARAADAPAASNAEPAAMHDEDPPASAAPAAPAASAQSNSGHAMDDTEEHKHAPAPLPVPTQSLRTLMTQQVRAAAAAAEHKRRLSPLAALLADEDGLAQTDEDDLGLMQDEPAGEDPAAATAFGDSNHNDHDSVGDEIEFEPSLVSLDGPAANRARFSRAQTEALAASVWPMHQRMQQAGLASSSRAGRKSDSSSGRRRGRSALRATEEEDESSLPEGLKEESDDAHYLDYNYAHSQAQRGARPLHARPTRAPHAREGSVELMPGSLFSAPPSQRHAEQRAAQPHEAFGGEASAALMTDSPGFGANAASSLISSIDLATGDGAASSSNPIARASQWLFTEVVKRTPLFGSATHPQHALAIPVHQLPPPFAADHQPVFGHAAAAAASSTLGSSAVFHSPLSSPLGRFSSSPSQTLFPSSSGGSNGHGGSRSVTQLSPPSFVANEEQIRRAVISSSSHNLAAPTSPNGVPSSPARRPRRRSLEAELKQSGDAAPVPAPVLLKRREAVVASLVGLGCYVAKESSGSLVSLRAAALLLYGLLLGSVAALLLWRSCCSRRSRDARSPQRRHDGAAVSSRSRWMVVAASVLLLVLAARALSQATGLIESLSLSATPIASAASNASSSSPTSPADLADPMLSRLAAALAVVQRLQSLLKELLRALVRWVSRHAEILLMIAAVAGIALTQRARG